MSASQSNIPLPSKLNITASNLSVAWRKFYSEWCNYEIATDLSEATDKKRVAIFLACAGPDAQELFETFDLSDEHRKSLDTVVATFKTHCVGIANTTYERYTFNRRSQTESESFDTFVADLRRLVKTCEYGVLADSIITDRIVMGIHDDATRERLLLKGKLDLQTAITICHAAESASRQLKDLHGTDTVESLKIDKYRRYRDRPQSNNRAGLVWFVCGCLMTHRHSYGY